MDMPPQATTGQACQGAPAGAVVTDRWITGTFQLTSATSDEPPSGGPGCSSSGSISPFNPFSSTPVARWIALAISCSSGENRSGPSHSRLAWSSLAPAMFGNIS